MHFPDRAFQKPNLVFNFHTRTKQFYIFSPWDTSKHMKQKFTKGGGVCNFTAIPFHIINVSPILVAKGGYQLANQLNLWWSIHYCLLIPLSFAESMTPRRIYNFSFMHTFPLWLMFSYARNRILMKSADLSHDLQSMQLGLTQFNS